MATAVPTLGRDPDPEPPALPMQLLVAIAISTASRFDAAAVDAPPPFARGWDRVYLSETFDIWLIRWGPGSGTECHDHGGSTGVLRVVRGSLVELRPEPSGAALSRRRDLREGDQIVMPARHIHLVSNDDSVAATRVHVYSPPLDAMNRYDMGRGRTRSLGSGSGDRLFGELAANRRERVRSSPPATLR